MKKLIIALICGWLLVPAGAWGQQWVDPYMRIDGTLVPGHWRTPEDDRTDRYSTPGKVNPYTGQFNPYTGSGNTPTMATPKSTPAKSNPYYVQPDYAYHAEPLTKTGPKNQNPYYPPPNLKPSAQ